MPASLRILALLGRAAALQALQTVRALAPAEVTLARSAEQLAAALREHAWDVLLVGADAPGEQVAAALIGARSAPRVVAIGPQRPPGLPGAYLIATPADAEAFEDALAERLGVLRAARPPSPPLQVAPPAAGEHDPGPPPGPPPARVSVPAEAPTRAPAPSYAEAHDELIRHLPVGVYRSTPEGRIVFANPALAYVLGCASPEELLRLDVRADLGYPRDEFAAQVLRYGAVRNLVVRWTNRHGRVLVTRENARAVHGPSGEVRYYEGTMEDVTAEVDALERDRVRVRQLQAIASFALAADEARSAEELHTRAVHAVADVLGAPWVMLLAGGSVLRPVAPAHACTPDVEEALAHLPLGAQPLLLADALADAPEPVAALCRRSNLRALAVFPLFHHGERCGAFVAGYPDARAFSDDECHMAAALAWHIAGATARAEAEAYLRESEASLRFIADNTGHALYRRRFDASFDYLSPAIAQLTGYSPEEIAARGGLRTLVVRRHVLSGAGMLTDPAAHDVPGAHYLARYEMRTRSGAIRWIENSAHSWRDEHGRPVGVVGVFRDVTERKRQEDEAARETARALARHRALAELAGLDEGHGLAERAALLAAEATEADRAGVWIAEDLWMVCRALPGADAGTLMPAYPIEAFDAVLAELHGHRVLSIADTATDARVERVRIGAMAAEIGVRALLIAPVRRAGEAIGMVALHRAAPYAWTDAEQAFAAAVADAVALGIERAERARAEEALRQSESRYRALSELSSDYAFAVHEHPERPETVAWATDAFRRISGYGPEDLGDFAGFLRLLHPDDAPHAAAAAAHLTREGTASFEARIVTRDGAERWLRHRARRGEILPDGTTVWYHSGQDVSQHKRFEAELIEAREQAEEMARLKTAFLANMSHEIRTPLTSILGYADLLADEVSEDQREFVGFIERSGMRLLDTLNSVLDLARLEAEGIRPELAPVDVAAEAAQAVRLLQPLATRKNLALVYDGAPEAHLALLDAACLGRVLTNLVGNAIKFTEAGEVCVAVRARGADVVLEVRDTGIGIDEAFLPHLFDEFRQETSGQARSHEGSGLGLAITRRLVELMNGTIAVESRRPGGSAFTVTFPRAAAALGDGAAPRSAHGNGYDDDLGDSRGDGHGSGHAGDGGGAPLAPLLVTPHANAPSRTIAPRLAPDAPERPGRRIGAPAAEAPAAGTPLADDAFHTLEPGLNPGPADAPDAPQRPADAPMNDHEYLTDPYDLSAFDGVAPGYDLRSAEGLTEGLVAPQREVPPASPPPLPAAPAPEVAFAPAFPVPAFASPFGPAAATPVSAPPATRAEGDFGPPPVIFTPASAPIPVAPAFVSVFPDYASPVAARAAEVPSDAEAPAFFEPVPSTPTEAPTAALPPSPVATAPEAPAPAAPEDDRPAVLVVEDNSDTRMLLERILRTPYRVTAVGEARAALLQMNAQRFDAFVLDINLGGKETGADVLRIARALPGYERVFAIALTAYALPGDRERLLEAGFDEYISKPFTRHALLEALAAGMAAAGAPAAPRPALARTTAAG